MPPRLSSFLPSLLNILLGSCPIEHFLPHSQYLTLRPVPTLTAPLHSMSVPVLHPSISAVLERVGLVDTEVAPLLTEIGRCVA